MYVRNRLKLEDRGILVAGANGFVGSNLVDELVDRGADVTAFVHSAHKGHRNLKHIEGEVKIVRRDLRDYRSVKDAVDSLEDDALIFHLGAQAHVGESWERPYETVDTNVKGTLNLLEAARSTSVETSRIDVAGSSEEYGNSIKEGESIDESHELRPESVYATSKVSADMLAMNYRVAS